MTLLILVVVTVVAMFSFSGSLLRAPGEGLKEASQSVEAIPLFAQRIGGEVQGNILMVAMAMGSPLAIMAILALAIVISYEARLVMGLTARFCQRLSPQEE